MRSAEPKPKRSIKECNGSSLSEDHDCSMAKEVPNTDNVNTITSSAFSTAKCRRHAASANPKKCEDR
uniref:Uncharacterized protein n=1 Tax=Peronospora matthiolae TaxID=2874970 RepID=A0AAV1TC93_9STRA